MLHKALYSGLWLIYFTVPVICLETLINLDVLPRPAGALSVVTLLPIYLSLFFPFQAVSRILDQKFAQGGPQ